MVREKKNHVFAAYKRHTSDIRTHTDWVWKDRNKSKSRVAILISDKTDFKTKTVIKDKDGYYIMIK